MNAGELSGYLASLLVFAAFYMKSMVKLRLVAIASNLAFIAYAVHGGLMPILLLHGALLPLNIQRLLELRRFTANTDEAENEELSLRPLMPHMEGVEFTAENTMWTLWQWAATAISRLLQRTNSHVRKSSEHGAP